MNDHYTALQQERSVILEQMAALERMERGRLSKQFVKGQKEGEPVTRGPYYVLQRRSGQQVLKERVPLERLPTVQADILRHEEFKKLADRYAQITEEMGRLQDAQPEIKKKDFDFQSDQLQETQAFLALAREQLRSGTAGSGAWIDQGLRIALHKDGCRLLEQLLQDPGLDIPGDESEPGEKCHPKRLKEVQTVLGTIRLNRSYFYRGAVGEELQGQGRFPLDDALGLINGYSPGMAKLMCRAGAMSSGYEAASADLKAYADLQVDGREIQRMINLKADSIETHARQCVPVQPVKPVDVLYVSVDGTGVPMVAEEVQGRAGKQEDGSSKTREAKLGCVFTQQTTDEEGRAMRDPDSTTYISSFACAKDFGPLIRAEALRRGMAFASIVVLLGDGAAWIWEIARTCFPFAVHIVDFFHACEHLSSLSEAIFGKGTQQAKEYRYRWQAYLEVDQVGALIAEAKGWLSQSMGEGKETLKEIGYFENNQSRMLYGTFRANGYFIGSGVVEAGCKTVIGQRVKQSGMLWSLSGADNVLAVRCALMNGDFESYWRQQGFFPAEMKKAA
jgi:hypothetical protein